MGRSWGIKVFQEVLQFVMFESPHRKDASDQTAFVPPSAAAEAATMLVSLPLPADSTRLCFFRPRVFSLLLFCGCVPHTPRQRLLRSWHFVCVVTWAAAADAAELLGIAIINPCVRKALCAPGSDGTAAATAEASWQPED